MERRELGASARVALGELVVPRVVVAFGGVETRVVARGVFGDDVAEFRALVRELAFLAPSLVSTSIIFAWSVRMVSLALASSASALRARARVLAVSRQLLDATAPRSNLPGGGGKGDAKISGAEVGGRAENAPNAEHNRGRVAGGGEREGDRRKARTAKRGSESAHLVMAAPARISRVDDALRVARRGNLWDDREADTPLFPSDERRGVTVDEAKLARVARSSSIRVDPRAAPPAVTCSGRAVGVALEWGPARATTSRRIASVLP